MELLNFAVIKNDNLQARFHHISYMVKAAGLNEAFHTQRGNLLLTVKEPSCMRLSKSDWTHRGEGTLICVCLLVTSWIGIRKRCMLFHNKMFHCKILTSVSSSHCSVSEQALEVSLQDRVWLMTLASFWYSNSSANFPPPSCRVDIYET